MAVLNGLPEPEHSPFNKSGTEARFAQRDYSEGMNQVGVDGDQNGASEAQPTAFAHGVDEQQCQWENGKEKYILSNQRVAPKSGEAGPGGDSEQDG
jgi:hypothetical protein